MPHEAGPNAWARRLAELRAAGAELFDLSEANPTRTGLSGVGPAERRAMEAAYAAALEGGYQPDPRGLKVAREAVAGYYASRHLAADPGHIVLTTGTSESYAHLFRLLADPGDAVLVPAPSYPLFEPLATLESLRVRSYALAYDGRWHLDLDSLERGLAAGAKAVIVVQPNHPTGTCLDDREVAALEELCVRHDAAIIADEVFGDYRWAPSRLGPLPPARLGPMAPERARPRTGSERMELPSLVSERRARTFVLSGLSKVCGLPQLKLGWIWAGGPAAERDRSLGALEWIADLFLSVGTPVQLALPALLEGRHAFRRRTLERVIANCGVLLEVAARRPELSVLEPEGGWVACVRLPARRAEEEWTLALLDRGVIVHPGHFYDFQFGPVIVLSLIVQPGVFARGLEPLETLLGES
jgi:aspartate/methionine/tyrosine aminotransferase